MTLLSRIQLLDEATANQIAAGEVVERPVSVVKELVENSLDAGAGRITVELYQGGLSGIKVIDNGCGMSSEDARMCFQRHATSKIRRAEDLNRVLTLGFRGEALPSIASVARVTLVTRTQEDLAGTEIRIEGGQVKCISPAGCPVGTSIEVQELFYNTPARRKYLKTPTNETAQISELLSKLALARPDVRIELRSGGRVLFCSPGNGSLQDTAASVFGSDNVRSMIEINHRGQLLTIQGLISKPVLTRASRQYQNVYINQRYIRSMFISSLLQQAYQTQIPTGRFPLAVLHISLDPEQVDVNVHPTKMEVRLAREREVAEELLEALSSHLHIPAAITGLWEMMPGRKERTAYQETSGLPEEPVKETPKTSAENQLTLSLSDKLIHKEETPFHEDSPVADGSFLEGNRSYEIRKESFPFLLPVGQVFPTYVLAQGEGGLYIIDQHAAHERILYEKYQQQLTRGVESQMLLEPATLEIPHHEALMIIKNIIDFSEMGFILEHFGGDTFILRGVPPAGLEKPAELFLDLLARLQDGPSNKLDRGLVIDRLAAAMACRDAVKSGVHLAHQEIRALLDGLSHCQRPYTCPHGRPTLIQISPEELNKRFKR